MLFKIALFATCIFIRHVSAIGVQIVAPAAGATFPPGPVTVNWTDAGGSPNMSSLVRFNLQLVVGGVDANNSEVVQNFTQSGLVSSGGTVAVIDSDVATSVQNGFYFKMVSNASDGNEVINYSNRFTMIDMSGTTNQTYLLGANAAAGDTNVPQAQFSSLASSAASSSTTSHPSASNVYITVTDANSPTATSFTSTGSDDQSGSSAGIIVGSVIGGVAFLVSFTCLVIWFARRYERKEKQRRDEPSDDIQFREDEAILDNRELSVTPDSSPASPPIELSSGQEHMVAGSTHEKAVELAEPEAVYELEGDWSPWEAGSGRRSRAWDPTE